MRLPFVAILILILLGFICDVGIFAYLCARYKQKKRLRIIYAGASVALMAMLIVTLLLPRRNPDSSILPVMWMLYAYLSVYFAKLVYLVSIGISLLPRLFKRKPWNVVTWIGLFGGILVFAEMWAGVFVTRRHIEVTQTVIESDKLPATFDGFKIAQFSDMHTGTWGSDTTFVSQMVDSINAQHPDIILFTGDIVNRKTDELRPFVKTLSRLQSRYGVYSVLGNHDYGDYTEWPTPEAKQANMDEMYRLQKEMGWCLLDNSSVTLGKGADHIKLIGVGNWGEPPFKQYGDLNKAYPLTQDGVSSLNDGYFKILMTHNPWHWQDEVAGQTNIDLSLSGHTHAMQFQIATPFGKWSPAVFRYPLWGGLYDSAEIGETSGRKLYVNIGCGEVALPSRLSAAYPEISVITLRRTPSK